jgi:phosphodiesterase/alkaline phosphatase D-like protein
MSASLYYILLFLIFFKTFHCQIPEKDGTFSIAFASCNRQNKPQHHWDVIKTRNPDLFLWTGDSVYIKNTSIIALEEGYKNLTTDLKYKNFRESVLIDGIWDDHDMGVNDGGKHVNGLKERQVLFRNYIRNTNKNGGNPENDKLYKIIDKKMPSGALIRFLILDTRSYRDHHYIRSLGEVKFPLSTIIAAALRATYTLMGWGRKYNGNILGEEQWNWMEENLQNSDANFHVIISSIQVYIYN